ncbi:MULTISPECIES: M28 family metallopeptidase [Edaphosphingomonas]|uniref:Peptidase M28 n=2 Tax=Edaphosphingomonas TaxID=3423724 RepID=A0A2T4HRB3_9SPHN|nr:MULTISPECIES: M28 family metallopeptidase [Sphingomonas]OHT21028.1 Peptidase family M28 [Sphingomonas haloaromaticamans]PTD18326.1 peptidase M28 [Sphingomonas fennica]
MRFALAASLLALSVATAAAAAPVPAINVETLKDITRTLSDDSFQGRAPATPAEDKTVAYIADRFARAGLKPGNKGSWYQDVPLVELTPNAAFPISITGGKTPITLDYKTDHITWSYQVQPRIDVAGSDIVFVGYGINAPERGWNDYAGLDVKGKTVLILINDPDWKMQSLDGPFGGRAMTYYGRWTYKYEEAARQGAAAAIIIHDTEPAAYGFNVVVSSNSGGKLGFDEPGNHMDQSAAAGWITNDAARRIFASAGQDYDALVAAAGQKGFHAVPFTGMKASLSFDQSIRRQKSKNVVGIIPGKKRPGEYVLYSAHWDHLGICEPVDGDNICNGAVDNASGTAGLVALAEAYKAGGQPDRSVVFLAVTAEESGLLGSEYYAANPIYPLARTVGGVNMDSLNVIGKTNDIVVVGPGKSELEDYLKRAAVGENRVLVPEPTPEKGYYYRSDHFSFAKLGVPMIYFESGEDLVNGGRERGSKLAADYITNRYHGPKDEYDPNWDWSGAVSDLKLFYTIGRELADSDAWPNWYPTAEFRAVRDKSRAGK